MEVNPHDAQTIQMPNQTSCANVVAPSNTRQKLEQTSLSKRVHGVAVPAIVNSGSEVDGGDGDAAYEAEMVRLDKLERRQMLFCNKYIAALTEWPPLDQAATFDEYWQGEGEFNGIRYKKSWQYNKVGYKIEYLTTTDGMVLYCHSGLIEGKNWPRW